VLIPASVADGIAAGEITVQFRWWTRPTVKAGGQLRSHVGVLQIDAVDAIAPSRITVADAHAAGYDSKAQAIRDQARYAQPDRRLYRIRFHRGGVDPRIALRDDTHLSPADLEAIERLDRAAAARRPAGRALGAHRRRHLQRRRAARVTSATFRKRNGLRRPCRARECLRKGGRAGQLDARPSDGSQRGFGLVVRSTARSILMAPLLIGYARVWTDEQDLTAQRDALANLGVTAERVYVDHGLTGTNRDRPGLREAFAACRTGDTLVVTKLDRLARSLPDARAIADELTSRQVKLALGTSVHDPTDPVGGCCSTCWPWSPSSKPT
jgi:hypothetical protein